MRDWGLYACYRMRNWSQPLAGRSKRIDTKVSILLGLQFLLFLSLTHTRDRRPLRKGKRQSGYSCVSFSAYSQFTDTVLLHIWFTLRRRNIAVLRNSFAWIFCMAPTNCIGYTVGCGKVNCGNAAREGALGYDLGAPFVSGLRNLSRRGAHCAPTQQKIVTSILHSPSSILNYSSGYEKSTAK